MPSGWNCDPSTDLCTFDEAPSLGAAIVIKEYATASILATDVWAIGAWNGVYGYPAEVEFFADRLTFACTAAQPQTLWLSRTGDYTFHGKSTPITDDDAIAATLNARGLNAIRDLVPLQSLIVLTSGSEWRANSGDGDVITPSTLGFRPQTRIGAANLPALVVGSTAIVAQSKGYAVYELAYDFAKDGFIGGDLLAFSGHLLEHHSLRDWTWQAVPYSVAWAVREDGLVLSMTYKQEQQVVGWMRHTTPEGTVEQTCTVPEEVADGTYMVVSRVVDGQVKRYIERIADPVDDLREYVGLDCALPFDFRNTTGTTIDLSTSGGWGVDDLLTATASTGIFAAGDVDDVIVLGYDDDVPLRLLVVENVSATVNKVRPMQPVATQYQSATTAWAFARNLLSGLDHLEGMEVYALVDGYAQGPFTVDSGDITLDPPGYLGCVGLAFDCDLETLDVNIVGGESVSSRAKLIREVALQVKTARGIHVGTDFDYLTEYPVRQDEAMGQLPSLTTGTIKVNVSGEWGLNGRVCVRHPGILPLEILSITPDVQFGG